MSFKMIVSGAVCAVASMAACLAVVHLARLGTGGEMIYPLDDTCIHLAMAKNIAFHGVWGIEPDRYAFCSSSPLWTLLLALAVKILGCRIWLPFALSVLCVGGIGAVAERFFARFGMSMWMRFAAVAALGWAAPFVVLAGMGMEHALHVLLVLCMVASYPRAVPLCIFAFLGTATRYETLFLVAPMALAMIMTAQWKRILPKAAAFVACGTMPAVIYAVFAVSHGGHVLPNSLLLKSTLLSTGQMDEVPFLTEPGILMLVLMAAMVAVAIWGKGELRACAECVAVASALHLVFVARFQFYRYEAYLVGAAAMLIAASLGRNEMLARPRPPETRQGFLAANHRLPALFAALAFAVMCGMRGWKAIGDEIHAPRDIYRQQVQLARFFASLPVSDRGPVAINDLGYMCLFCGAPVVDIWGLGTQRAAELHLAAGGAFLPENIDKLMKEFGVKYAALFPKWFKPVELPDSLYHVAILKNQENEFCGQDEVWLYGNGAEARESLRRAAEAFKGKLPEGAALAVESARGGIE